MRTFNHFGFPTNENKEYMTYVPALKLAVSDISKSKNSIEWLKFDFDCTMPKLMQDCPHIAYTVDNLDEELKTANILVPPHPLGENARFAYIVEEGIPVELIEKK